MWYPKTQRMPKLRIMTPSAMLMTKRGAALIVQAACHRGDERAGRAQDAESAGRPRPQMVVRRAQQERQRRPEGAEGSEEQAALKRRLADQPLPPNDGSTTSAVPGRSAGDGWAAAAEKLRHRMGTKAALMTAAKTKNRAPAEKGGDASSDGAGQQHAQQQAGHDRANGSASLGLARDFGRNGQHDMGDSARRTQQHRTLPAAATGAGQWRRAMPRVRHRRTGG